VAKLGAYNILVYYDRIVHLLCCVASGYMIEDKQVAKVHSTTAQLVGLLALGILVILGLLFSYAQIQPGHYQAENLPRTAGIVNWTPRAAFSREVCGLPGQSGALTFGPYDWYDAGSYKTSFYQHNAAEAGTVVGRVEVSDAETGVVLASRDIVSSDVDDKGLVYQLEFSLSKPSMLEFRTWYYGTGRLCIDQVTIQSSAG
jgi:hypothetical protein